MELMDSKLTLNISAYELKNKNKALDPAVIPADRKGDAADTVVKKKSALAGL